MIKLTKKDGSPSYFNPDRILYVRAYGDEPNGSAIHYGDDGYIVSESPEEVVRKIMDYKLEMVRYKAAIENNEFMIAADHHARLDDLAGLEAETE